MAPLFWHHPVAQLACRSTPCSSTSLQECLEVHYTTSKIRGILLLRMITFFRYFIWVFGYLHKFVFHKPNESTIAVIVALHEHRKHTGRIATGPQTVNKAETERVLPVIPAGIWFVLKLAEEMLSNISVTSHMMQLSLVPTEDILRMFICLHFSSKKGVRSFHIFR